MVRLAKCQNVISKLTTIVLPEDICVSQCAVIRDPLLGLFRTMLIATFAVWVIHTFFLKEDQFQLEIAPTVFRSFWASSGHLSSKKAEVEQGLLPYYCNSKHFHWSSTGTLHHDFICLTGSYSEMHYLGESTIFFPTHIDQKTSKQTRCAETNMTAFCSEQDVTHRWKNNSYTGLCSCS